MLEKALTTARKEIDELERYAKENEIKEFNLTSAYWKEYYPIRTNLRKTREELRSLARQTVEFGEEMEIYFKSTLANDKKLKLTMSKLKAFVERSAQVLGKAKIEYQTALTKMEEFLPKFKLFEKEMEKLTDYESEDFKTWAANLRKGVYVATGGGTVACGIADILLVGMCSAIYNSIAWPAAIAGVEASIAAYKKTYEEAERIGNKIVKSMGALEGDLDYTIAFLVQELDIIREWEEVVENAEENIKLIPREDIPALPQVFLDDIADMKRVAQKFLQRPVDIFGDDAPQADKAVKALLF